MMSVGRLNFRCISLWIVIITISIGDACICPGDETCCAISVFSVLPMEGVEAVQSGGNVIKIQTSWAMALIGALLAVLLICNMVFMCYTNCNANKGHYVVQEDFDDSEA
eukprot:16666_1